MGATLTVNITQNSQSITNNTSNVTVNAVVSWTGGTYNALGQCTGSITIDGTKYSFSGMSFNSSHTTSGKQTVMTKTVNVKHNDDGTKNLAFSASFNTVVSAGTIGASATKTLTTIPRKSSLSVGNGTLDTSQTLTVTRKSTSFTHTITATCSGSTSTICTKSKTESLSFKPPLDWASKNTTGTSVSVTYTITTYNGTASVGSNTYTKTCSIPAKVKPSCAISVTDATGYETTYGKPIKGLSKFKVTVTPTKSYGSDIVSYSATANGSTYTSASFTTDILKSSGTLAIKATVKDKRGRVSDEEKVEKDVYNYSAPKFTLAKASRCDENGNANDRGAFIRVEFDGSITDLDGQNSKTFDLQYKRSDTNDFSGINPYYLTSPYIFPADEDSSYDIELFISDKFNTTSRTIAVSTAFTIMHWKADGTAMAIGKITEKSGQFEVGIPTQIDKPITSKHNDTSFVHDHPGGTVVAFGVGSGGVNSGIWNDNLDRWVFRCNNENSYIGSTYGEFKPYYSAGDSFSLSIHTAGYLTNSKTQVNFTIPVTRFILGSPKISAVSGTGFMLRQNGSYTHGSTWDSANSQNSPVKGDTIEASYNANYGIRIKATFSDTTNAINNAPIGIDWQGTITFSE